MDSPRNHEIIALSKSFELHCNTVISSWIYSNQFIIMGTISGSLILYNKSDTSKRSILAFPELMETITSISLLNGRTNDLLLGTKKGSLALVSFRFSKDNIADQSYSAILNLQEEVIDIILHLNQLILVCTTKKLVMLRYDAATEGQIKILEKRTLFESDTDIIQVNMSETRALVSTWKSYFVVNIFGEESVQVGSKEKQGVHGGTFFLEETGLTVYAGRPLGRLWKANILTGKVLNTIQFSSEDGKKLNIGKLKDFDKYILSYNEDNLAIFDPYKNEILKDERFSGPFLPFFSESLLPSERSLKNQKSKFFSLLFQENEKVIIKECKICDIKEAFNDCFGNEDIDEAIRMFIKHEDLWSEKNLDMIFQKKDNISDLNILEDPALGDIIDKIEEQNRGPSVSKKPTLADFEDLEVIQVSTDLITPIEEPNRLSMVIRPQHSLSVDQQKFSAVCIGRDMAKDQEINLQNANQRLRKLTEEMREKSELIFIINLYNRYSGNESPEFSSPLPTLQALVKIAFNLESRALLNIISSQRPIIACDYSRFLISMHIERYYTEQCSLVRMEQLNPYIQKQIKKDSVTSVIGSLLLKQRLYGFLNSYEKILVKYK